MAPILLQNPNEAFKNIRRGERIFIATGAGAPQYLIQSMVVDHAHFADNEIVHLNTLGEAPYLDEKYSNNFRHNALFIGSNSRYSVNKLGSAYTPVFLSEVPNLFTSERLKLGACLIQVTHGHIPGYYNLGVSVDVARAAIRSSRIVIAQFNYNMPKTFGDSEIPEEWIHYLIPYDEPLPEHQPEIESPVSNEIAEHVSRLVEDGSTLQFGIGELPDAIASAMVQKNDLGIHSEVISNGVMRLIQSGNVSGLKKSLDRGQVVTSFAIGNQEFYQFLNDRKGILFRETRYTNHPTIISQQKKMVAINSALQVDLTGQVSSDSIGHYLYSGIGGQVDFIRGASLAESGLPIIALPSTAQAGDTSRIVAQLPAGSGVVTSRGDVHYVVTEFGVADLYGKTIEQRALSLIEIAHPQFRNELLEEAKRCGLIRHDYSLFTLDAAFQKRMTFTYESKLGKRITIRPIRPSDADYLQEFFYSHDQNSVYNRYGLFKKFMHHAEAVNRVYADGNERMALLAVSRGAYGERILGIIRFDKISNSSEAEAAVIIDEAHQKQGIAKKLAFTLEKCAQEAGITSLMYNIRHGNEAMLHAIKQWYPGIQLQMDEDFFVANVQISKDSLP